MSAARPFQLLTASRLAEANAALGQALQAWCTEWRPLAPVAGALTIAARHATECAEEPGLLAGDPAGVYVWVPSSGLEVMAAWLFNTDTPLAADGGIAHEVASDALRHLLQAWLGTPDVQQPLRPMALPASAAQPGVPVAAVELPLGLRSLRAVVRLPDATAEALPAATAAGALKLALQCQLVTLSADLGEVEIDLRTLDKLAVGDVIRFDTALDAPLRLRVDGRPLDTGARAHPGMLNGKRALEIVNHRKTP